MYKYIGVTRENGVHVGHGPSGDSDEKVHRETHGERPLLLCTQMGSYTVVTMLMYTVTRVAMTMYCM